MNSIDRSKPRPTFLGLPIALIVAGWICSTSDISSAANEGAHFILNVNQSAITVNLSPNLPLDRDTIKNWVQRAAEAVTKFYGKYPVPAVSLHISAADSGGVQAGEEFNGERIIIQLGQDTTPSDLLADWMLTHEMFHLSQPDLGDSYSWMSEGMADYLEPVARVRLGQITEKRFWKDLVEGMPQGLPKPGDRGLDHTHTWGRTYWGGSLFWLLADIRIREQTHNVKSVRDAAQAVLNNGGDGSQDWTIDQLLTTYDQGTGTKVFETLHNEMGDKPVATDLDALWKSLGVIYSQQSNEITFDDQAPLAEIRRGITVKETETPAASK